MKQETLEEVAKRILANNIDGLKDALNDDDLFFFYKGVVQCYGEAMAEWQQEQDKNKYSEEDLISLLEFNYKKETNQLGTLRKDYSQKIVKEWFETFKEIR